MPNTLYLPELREMLAEEDAAGLAEFCTALHPARTAEFMEGLYPQEKWAVLRHAEPALQAEVFAYFDHDEQVEMIHTLDRAEVGAFIGAMPPDDRVDLLHRVRPDVFREILTHVPAADRRDILRLRAYPEETAGAVMTTQFARLGESLTVRQAMEEIGRQAEDLETIYYLYIVDDEDHLRGVVSFRQLVSKLGKPDTPISELAERDVVTAGAMEDQEQVAQKVAHYNLHAIPVVDDEYRLVGIITHDDVIDVVVDEATEDAHRIAAVDPLEHGYLETSLWTLSWKRGIWLTVLFACALLTAYALGEYNHTTIRHEWLVLFIPLVISSGGNSGSQTATLVITALSTGNITRGNWLRVVVRELLLGLVLGGFLALIGFGVAVMMVPAMVPEVSAAAVVPCTILLVVVCGTLLGSLLPLLFSRMGLDPAMMSNPFVAGIIDILGIVIYMNVALYVLAR